MDWYSVSTIYILIGVATYIDHLVYVHDVTTVNLWYFKETRKFTYFILAIVFFPILIYATMKIRYYAAKEFKQWCKENRHNVK